MLRLLGAICLGTAWLVPNHYVPWVSFYNESMAAAGLILLALAAGRGWLHLRLPATPWVVFGCAVIPLLQWRFGLLDFGGDAWVATLYICGLAIAIACGYVLSAEDFSGTATHLSATLLSGSLISAVLGLSQAMQIRGFGIWVLDPMPGMRAYANLAQPNNLATLIGMGVVSLFLLLEKGRLNQRVSLVCLGILIVGASLTQSRTALLFGPLIWVTFRFAKQHGTRFKTNQLTILMAIGVHWALTWGWPLLQRAMMMQAPPSLSERGVESVRFHMWPLLVGALNASPWSGFGWLQVGAAELSVADRYQPVGELWLHGHNLFLEFLVWCGYPLGLMLCALVLYWFASRWVRTTSIEGVGGLMIVAVFGSHAMFELPHHYAYFLVPVGLWVGLIERDLASPGLLQAKYSLLFPVVSLPILIGLWKNYPSVEEDFRAMRFETIGIKNEGIHKPFVEAPFLSSLTSFLRFTRTAPSSGMSGEDLTFMESVTKRYPYAPVMYRLAIAWALNGRADDARRLLVKVRHMYDVETYMKMRSDLRRRGASGDSALLRFEQTLPDEN